MKLIAQVPSLVPKVSGIPDALQGDLNTSGANLLQLAINSMLMFATIAALAVLIFGGIRYITSGGDPVKISSARLIIVYALIGLIISIGAFVIVNFVLKAFGANSASFFGG